MSLRFEVGGIQFLIRDFIEPNLDFSDPSSIPPEYFTLLQPEEYTQATLSFLGCNPVIPIGKNSIEDGFFSYYEESETGEYLVSNPFYSKLIYHNLYPYIDLIYELRDGVLKYEFFVYPGGNIADIQLQWAGPVLLDLLSTGIVVTVITSSSPFTLIDSTPIYYQDFDRTEPIAGFFTLIDPLTYGFLVPTYNPNQLLIIDPVIAEIS